MTVIVSDIICRLNPEALLVVRRSGQSSNGDESCHYAGTRMPHGWLAWVRGEREGVSVTRFIMHKTNDKPFIIQ